MNFRKFAVSMVAVFLIFLGTAAQAAPIDNLRTSVSPARVRIVLDSKEPIVYKQDKDGLELTIALPQSSAKKQQPKIKDDSIESVRLLPDGKQAAKLVVKLKKDCQYKIYQLKEPNRLVLDIFRINIVRQEKNLAKGVTYTYLQDEINGRQIQAYLVSVDPKAKYELLPFSAAGMYNGRGKLSQQAVQQKILAAINASYFDKDGWVIGTIKDRGRMMAMDAQPRTAFAAKDGEEFIVEDVAYNAVLQITGGAVLHIKGMNRARIADDLVLYNSFYATSTKTNAFGREVKIKNNRVIAVSTAGNMSIEPDTYVISGHGVNAQALAALRVGDPVALTESLGSDAADDAATIVSGGPLLVKNGRANVRIAEEKIAKDIYSVRAPRTAVGLKKDGTLLLLVVDGRSNNSSGLTLQELAQYLLRLGAADAVNFDGGGSSEMVVNGKIVNKPSDGRERLVSIGLGLFTKK